MIPEDLFSELGLGQALSRRASIYVCVPDRLSADCSQAWGRPLCCAMET
jgi:hypothetical protein